MDVAATAPPTGLTRPGSRLVAHPCAAMADRGGGCQAIALASGWADVTVFVGGLVARDEEEDTDRGSLALPTAQVRQTAAAVAHREDGGGRRGTGRRDQAVLLGGVEHTAD